MLFKIFQKLHWGGMLANPFYEATTVLIPKPDKDAAKKFYTNFPDEIRNKNHK
jgi:hypothetical protein